MTDQTHTREMVAGMLEDIRQRGEAAVRELAAKFDNWTGDFILNGSEKEDLSASVPQPVKDDIAFICPGPRFCGETAGKHARV